MKICPSCDEPYDDEPVFCELDGTPLVVVAGRQAEKGEGQKSTPVPRPLASQQEAQRERNWSTLFMGIALGVLVCAAAFAIFSLVQHEDKAARVHEPLKAGVGTAQAPASARPIPDEPSPAPVDSPTPVEEPTPTADAPASTTEPPPPLQQEDGLETLSDSPASIGSTSGGRGERQLAIHLNNGTTFIADDAWRAPGGVWYRQGGVVSLLEHSRIRSVERLPVPKLSPASQ